MVPPSQSPSGCSEECTVHAIGSLLLRILTIMRTQNCPYPRLISGGQLSTVSVMRLLGTSAVWADGGKPFAAPYSNGYENPGVFPAAVDLERPAEYGRGHEVLEVSGIGADGGWIVEASFGHRTYCASACPLKPQAVPF